MQNIIHPSRPCPIAARGSAVMIGNFDGVHLGHQALIKAGLETGLNLVALSFDPHPKSFFSQKPHFQITPLNEKATLLHVLGVSHLALCPFNTEFANLEAQEFIDSILVNWLGAKVVITGEGFRFGKARAGNGALLSSQHFTYKALPPVKIDGQVVSSSRIRKALETGDLPLAKTLLGRDYGVSGLVIHGRKEGRELGYPTANIALDPANGLKYGIYAVLTEVSGIIYKAVASFGRRPMFDNGKPLLEVHLFDYKGDLYDQTIKITFKAYLRGEEKFDNLDALILQMNEDSRQAKQVLGA